MSSKPDDERAAFEYMGMKVFLDESLAANTFELRDSNGRTIVAVGVSWWDKLMRLAKDQTPQ
jgi:hypothetical protein